MVKKLLVLAPVSEYRGDRIPRLIARLKAKTPDLDVVTSREIWLATRPRKPAYVTHSQWREKESGFYIGWVATYRRELAKHSAVLIVPRVDGTVGNGTRVDLKQVRATQVHILMDGKIVPFTMVDAKNNRLDKVNSVQFSVQPQLARI